ncbi:MAG: recombinase family protein [Candidatus Omnitrophica bacterium]|nr:recombinase family protein [Candidatus Omnitrophota bacterium]
MGKIVAYIRTSTDKQDLNNQKLQILEFAREKNLKINEFIKITISSGKTSKQRRIDELMQRLEDSDCLIVTELSRIGRSTAEVINLINELINRSIRVIVIKQNLDISKHDMMSKVMVTLFSLFSELERDLVSLRTKDALAAKKAQGIKLGKPIGTIQKSKFDKDIERIEELIGLGLSVRKIAKVLSYPNHISLNTYIRKRGIRKSLGTVAVVN